MKLTLNLLLLLCSVSLFAQQPHRRKADQLFDQKNYKQAVQLYIRLAKTDSLRTDTALLYNTIASFAALKKPDSCVTYLNLLAATGYNNFTRLQTDVRLAQLQNNSQWYALLQKIKKQNTPIAPLVVEFKELLHTFQTNYKLYRLMMGRYGHNAPVVRAMRQQFRYDDSLTLYKVMSIVNTYGWLGKQRFGSVGPEVILIAILHADLAMQKKYFSVISDAAKNGDYPPESLGFLADVIALNETGQQVYGTIISRRYNNRYIPYPIVNEAEVDARRQSIGLAPLSEYLVKYDPAFLERFYLIE